MLNFIALHKEILAVILSSALGLTISVSFIVIHVVRRRRRLKVMSLSAAEFHDLAIIKRNARLKKELSKAYSEIKSRVFGVTVGGRYRLLFSLDRWYRRHNELTREEFDELFGKPLTDRLRKEGFTVDYFPSGSVELKRHKGDPAIDIRWAAVDAENEPETELKTKNSWN